MLFGDIVEPTDNLYKEGNIINKHTQKRKKKNQKETENSKGKDKKKEKETEGTGLIVDFEV